MAILQTIVTWGGAAGAVVAVPAVGWYITSRVGRLARETSQAIADTSAAITKQQLAVAKSAMEINHQALILNLMPKRTELHEELVAAIHGRNQEITTNDYQNNNFSTDQLNRLWTAQHRADKLFGQDVRDTIAQIVGELEKRNNSFIEIRTKTPNYDHAEHDKALAAAVRIEELKGDLAELILSYSSLGHVRSLPAPTTEIVKK